MYDMQYNYMIGSMGSQGDASTGGGGHIHINVESVNFTGEGVQLQANGLPLET